MSLLANLDAAINNVLNGKRYFTPSEKTTAINLAQIQLFKETVGPVSGYQLGRPVPAANFQETSITYGLVNEFYKTGVLTTTTTSNIGTEVWDVNDLLDEGREIYDVRILRARYDADQPATMADIKVLPDNQVQTRINSALVPPTEAKPIGEYFPDWQYGVFPLPEEVVAKFLIVPLDCEIVYDNGSFDEGLSTNLEWSSDAFTALFTRTLTFLGVDSGVPGMFQEGVGLSNKNI